MGSSISITAVGTGEGRDGEGATFSILCGGVGEGVILKEGGGCSGAWSTDPGILVY